MPNIGKRAWIGLAICVVAATVTGIYGGGSLGLLGLLGFMGYAPLLSRRRN